MQRPEQAQPGAGSPGTPPIGARLVLRAAVVGLLLPLFSSFGSLAALGQETGGSQDPNVARDVRDLAAVLTDEMQPQVRRDEAARRLAARQSTETRRVLVTTLVNIASPRGQLAVARALAASPGRLSDDFVTPLNALLGPDRQLTEAAAEVLSNCQGKPEVQSLLVQFVQNKANPETSRSAVARALGGGAGSAEKRVASALLGVLSDVNESPVVRGAAADALAELTGLKSLGRDVLRWQRWWDEQAPKSDAQFRDEILTRRGRLFDQLQAKYASLTDDLATLLAQEYRSVSDPSEKSERLQRLLRSPQPAIRVAGARIVYGDALENRTIPPGAREALRQLIGDSATEVRLEAVETLRALNDAASIDPLLTQLPQEADPEVRAAIAGTLGPIRDPRAVTSLVRLLDDDYARVAESAAESLASLGAEIRRDPALADLVTAALRRTLDARTAPRTEAGGPANPPRAATDDLRGAIIEALVPLHRRELISLFQAVLRPSESSRVRRAALKGLAELHEPDSAVAIISALEDLTADSGPAPASSAPGGSANSGGGNSRGGVRLEAVNALGAIPTFEHAEILYRRLSPDVEPDPAVRARAWAVLLELFPMATRDRLVEWAERFKDQPERRLGVLRALERKLTAPGDDEQLALTQQQIGETLLKLEKPDDAASELRAALDYWRSRSRPPASSPIGTPPPPGGAMYLEALYQSTIDALLRARQYTTAAQFASQSIADSEANQQTMGPRLREEVQKLITANDADAAALLLGEIRGMSPPLAPRYLEDLAQLAAKLPSPTGVSPAPAPVPPTQPAISVTPSTLPATRP